MQVTSSDNLTGLSCHIFRSSLGESSNGGISSRCNAVTLVGLGVRAEIFKETSERPAVKLVKRDFGGTIYLHAEPVDQPSGLVGPMFGGTFIYSSDSRFPAEYPIALHDRWETQETYDILSR